VGRAVILADVRLHLDDSTRAPPVVTHQGGAKEGSGGVERRPGEDLARE
jgi:hypothetical protein